MMTDPIADMLTRIRNAGSAGHRWADVPLSKLKVEVARLLKENAFVHDFKVLNDGRHGLVRVYLKYHEGEHVIRRIARVSRPGRRRYVGVEEIPRVRNGLGMAMLSTSRGLLSDRAARQAGVGGELLAVIW
ncbi:MAG: 30S ribosomal protein S8 [Gemmatimonadetes bacterium]|nr:30S ribosomal protein S8 [Gemmatimonadota bacterium]MCY3611699.1 30S ribosomal protein S8 [Gemmatimonadota bacterium]MCY3679583.1 30S ribosomal protein S8 [Gemmatimonadota bacterium]MYA42049.1 30S ribosomal protein S8 [Gemmatimonadota bacterium]MYE92933.1 30S ribosomal protein S8 [Gemmatimonadota bacterium]